MARNLIGLAYTFNYSHYALNYVKIFSSIMRRTNPDAERPFRAPLVPLVPILGILTCLLLMFSLPAENWLRLGVRLLVGFVIYFSYGRRHSRMRAHLGHEIAKHGVSPATRE